jgi:hypothetical protein
MIVDHSLVGTPGYQAPEFLKGDQPQEGAQLLKLKAAFIISVLKTARAAAMYQIS